MILMEVKNPFLKALFLKGGGGWSFWIIEVDNGEGGSGNKGRGGGNSGGDDDVSYYSCASI